MQGTDKEFLRILLDEAKSLGTMAIGFERRVVLFGAYRLAYGEIKWRQFNAEMDQILSPTVELDYPAAPKEVAP